MKPNQGEDFNLFVRTFTELIRDPAVREHKKYPRTYEQSQNSDVVRKITPAFVNGALTFVIRGIMVLVFAKMDKRVSILGAHLSQLSLKETDLCLHFFRNGQREGAGLGIQI